MSAHVDKTLHWKISGNINDADTFPISFLKNVIFRHESVHEFMREFAHEFVDEFLANFVHEFKYEIRTNSCEFFAQKIGCVRNGLYCILC